MDSLHFHRATTKGTKEMGSLSKCNSYTFASEGSN